MLFFAIAAKSYQWLEYAPAGKTPVAMAVGGTRHKLSMIATVTHQGKTRWMAIDEAFDAEKFIEFLNLSL